MYDPLSPPSPSPTSGLYVCPHERTHTSRTTTSQYRIYSERPGPLTDTKTRTSILHPADTTPTTQSQTRPSAVPHIISTTKEPKQTLPHIHTSRSQCRSQTPIHCSDRPAPSKRSVCQARCATDWSRSSAAYASSPPSLTGKYRPSWPLLGCTKKGAGSGELRGDYRRIGSPAAKLPNYCRLSEELGGGKGGGSLNRVGTLPRHRRRCYFRREAFVPQRGVGSSSWLGGFPASRRAFICKWQPCCE